MDQRIEDLRSLIEGRYPHLGAVREIAKQESEAVYSNDHYFVETVRGRFFLKQFENADSDSRLVAGVNWKPLAYGSFRLAASAGLADGAPDSQLLIGYSFDF